MTADDNAKNADADQVTEVAATADKSGGTFVPRVWLVAGVLVLLLLNAGGLAGWLYFAQYRDDKQTDKNAAQSAVNAARDGTIALLSYKPETLDQDFAAAKSHLTGDFLNYYNEFTQQIVTPAAKEKSVTTTAQVVRAAVSELHPDSAVVLVFVNQSTTSKDRPEPAMAASSVLVSMTKVDDKWLITKFDPV
ncbi:heat shock protein DnaJ domain-containing protein [Nocardioides sp. JS614] [Mycobacterium shimoidei]|uniref:Heat shock protein DnaJ domain-containing protein [Nocardioides sp. JS614] n=1 Tax=Mycobacterium shimoidei TaxID=29313 RepID=A0A375Z0J8_MYCSH|nr:heat shock protein DnaJ domain-containing protein [Nocardioides sp. JS614] [Mycobacterium shimoidei]